MLNLRLLENDVFGIAKKMIMTIVNTEVAMFSVVIRSKKGAGSFLLSKIGIAKRPQQIQ
jgi:hypothetical protein